MKQLYIILLALCFQFSFGYAQKSVNVKTSFDYVDSVNRGLLKEDTRKQSVKRKTVGKIGAAAIEINYSSPGVRGRIIWGGVVPYEEIWVAGAHLATTISISHNMLLGGKELKKGKYALFMIPRKGKWTVVINKNFEQHLTDEYDASMDVCRIEIAPVENNMQSRLTYTIQPKSAQSGELIFAWEKVKLIIPMKQIK
jgi:hypothetical protein